VAQPLKIRWLRRALANLEAEAAFIAEERPEAAAIVVTRIVEAVELPAEQPALGRSGRVVGTRELVVAGTPYRVPYRVRRDAVEILRVFHTARRPPKTW